MSSLYYQLGYSTGELQAVSLIVSVVFDGVDLQLALSMLDHFFGN